MASTSNNSSDASDSIGSRSPSQRKTFNGVNSSTSILENKKDILADCETNRNYKRSLLLPHDNRSKRKAPTIELPSTPCPNSPKREQRRNLLEKYLEVISNIYYKQPTQHSADLMNGFLPLQHASILGALTSPIRRVEVIDKWSPYEVACFEAALCVHGKQFHILGKIISTKTTKEIIEFYYIWKKSSHYCSWKRRYESI